MAYLFVISGLDPEFKEHLKFFTESLFAPENVVIKSINGKAVTGEELLEYIKVVINSILVVAYCLLLLIIIALFVFQSWIWLKSWSD